MNTITLKCAGVELCKIVQIPYIPNVTIGGVFYDSSETAIRNMVFDFQDSIDIINTKIEYYLNGLTLTNYTIGLYIDNWELTHFTLKAPEIKYSGDAIDWKYVLMAIIVWAGLSSIFGDRFQFLVELMSAVADEIV